MSLPVEAAPITEDADEEETTVTQPAQEKGSIPPEWLKPGLSVTHIKYGNGIISSVSAGKYISFTVLFEEDGEKKFLYPDAFIRNHLKRRSDPPACEK